ncbi:MAG: hypothetical protein ACI9M9_000135 [Flavobacteriaceae bacterium]|jgi:hypothetical protein
MTTDMKINKPAPINAGEKATLFTSVTDIKSTIQVLEANKPVVITAFTVMVCHSLRP